MSASRRLDPYPYVWRLPLLIWQGAFFVIPLLFMAAMSFWLVKNYRMEPDFVFDNWARMLGRNAFWDAYWITLWRALLAGVIASAVAFPASLFLAFSLGESGPVNAALGGIGLGPYTMLNSGFGTMVGYLTLVLPLVVIFQTWSLAAIDKSLIEAAGNLGASAWRTLVSVILPAAKTGLVLGALFAFIMTFGDFVSPFYLGGSKPPTLTILIIDTTKSGQQWPRAAVVAIMMILTLFAVALAAVKAAYRGRT